MTIGIIWFYTASAAEKGTQYDVNEFDIAGVKLGMSWHQAMTALTTQLNIKETDLRLDQYPNEDIVLQQKIPKYFVYEKDGIRVQVSFVAAIPVDQTNPLRANLIFYEANRTDENMQNMRSKSIEKYGIPTNGIRDNDHVSTKYSWCRFDESIKFNTCSNAIGAKLELTAPKLSMSDGSYLKKVQAYMDKKKSVDIAF